LLYEDRYKVQKKGVRKMAKICEAGGKETLSTNRVAGFELCTLCSSLSNRKMAFNLATAKHAAFLRAELEKLGQE
ncbi:MAG: hypothetical protein ABSC19_20105, partial [Syntrophorhabdales bacterium]